MTEPYKTPYPDKTDMDVCRLIIVLANLIIIENQNKDIKITKITKEGI